MIAAWKGIMTSPDDMIVRAELPTGQHSYTFNQIILAAQSVGLQLSHRTGMELDDILLEVRSGRPVITLLRYGEISGNLDKFVGSHFWVVTGYGDNFVYVNDPDWWLPYRQGGIRRMISISEFKNSIGDALLETGNQPYQSLVLG